jgi:ABC-type sugar transport system ATPase subunit
VLLLAEPTKGVDIGAKAEIYEIIFRLVQQGIALIITSSELPELLAVCDRFLVLARGKVVDAFAKSEATELRAMRAASGACPSATLSTQVT